MSRRSSDWLSRSVTEIRIHRMNLNKAYVRISALKRVAVLMNLHRHAFDWRGRGESLRLPLRSRLHSTVKFSLDPLQ